MGTPPLVGQLILRWHFHANLALAVCSEVESDRTWSGLLNSSNGIMVHATTGSLFGSKLLRCVAQEKSYSPLVDCLTVSRGAPDRISLLAN
jgi:hypothetical protein